MTNNTKGNFSRRRWIIVVVVVVVVVGLESWVSKPLGTSWNWASPTDGKALCDDGPMTSIVADRRTRTSNADGTPGISYGHDAVSTSMPCACMNLSLQLDQQPAM
ncbi:hypothetical protein B0I35DRAFT_460241 [Stachybotrys elegans]|uniref:Uncharacterized protein n=1 Tax=Stachybotrys elegans TaxID=80388 RepID=A0A8K0WRF1_9HYPO|nr:hypothetical protein B0I35DRAFT_460241 [Stachybotrys elegans]